MNLHPWNWLKKMYMGITRVASEPFKIWGTKILPVMATLFFIGMLLIVCVPMKFLPSGTVVAIVESLIGISIFFPILKLHKKYILMELMTGTISLSLLFYSHFDGDTLSILQEITPLPLQPINIRQWTSSDDYNFQNYMTSILFEDTDADLLKDDYEKTDPNLVFNYYYPNNSSSDPTNHISDICGILNLGEDFDEYSMLDGCLNKLPALRDQCVDKESFFKANNSLNINCSEISLDNFDSVYNSLTHNEKLLN